MLETSPSYDPRGNVAVIELNGLNAGSGSTMELMGGNIPPSHPIDTTSFPGHHVETTLLTMDYCGDHIYRNGVLERTMNDYGYLADSTYYYYIKDYQDNVPISPMPGPWTSRKERADGV